MSISAFLCGVNLTFMNVGKVDNVRSALLCPRSPYMYIDFNFYECGKGWWFGKCVFVPKEPIRALSYGIILTFMNEGGAHRVGCVFMCPSSPLGHFHV